MYRSHLRNVHTPAWDVQVKPPQPTLSASGWAVVRDGVLLAQPKQLLRQRRRSADPQKLERS